MEGAKHIPAAESGLVSMLDVVLGPLWVYLFFGEFPGPMAIIGGAMVIGALIWRLAPEIGRGRNAPALVVTAAHSRRLLYNKRGDGLAQNGRLSCLKTNSL